MKKDKKIKIGLLNFHYSNNNYGAVIQAYCLQEVIKSLGYDVKTINYLNLSKNPIKAFNQIRENNSKKNVFQIFRNKYIRTTFSFPYNFFLIKLLNFNFTHFIVGSDQVWRYFNSNNKFNNYTYYFDFVLKNKKKISYAASFGIDKWPVETPQKVTNKISKLINDFDYISVREKSGILLCQKNFSITPELVLDPTLLVSKHKIDNLCSSNTDHSLNSYIAIYKLDQDRNFNEFIDSIMSVDNLDKIDIYRDDKSDYRSIEKYLSLIKNSELIVTDSFHCICFAIVFSKNFIYYPNYERGLTRISSLFEELEICKSNIYIDGNYKEFLDKRELPDFGKIAHNLNKLQIKSINFLKKSLK
jgi:hypothetical protein